MLHDHARLRHIIDARGRRWPIPAGGSTDDPPPADEPPGDPPAEEPPAAEDDEPLGDAGKKALEQERAARREAEKARKTLEGELEKVRRQSMSEQERAIAEARDQARNEALAEANRRIVAADVKAAAAGKLTNPALAVRLLDLDQFEVDSEGNTDVEAISTAIDGLLQTDPYLAAGATPRPPGDGGGGPRGPAPKPNRDMDSLLRAAVRGRK